MENLTTAPSGNTPGGIERRPKSVSNSTLSQLKRILEGKENEPLPTFVFDYGKLVDAMITTPNMVDYNRRMLKPNPVYPDDKPVFFGTQQWVMAIRNRDTFFDDKQCADIWSLAVGQHKSRREDQEFEFHGVKFKLDTSCRWDLWVPTMHFGLEFKTTGAQTLADFRKACDLYDYDRAAYWYMNCSQSDQYLIVGVTKTTNKIHKIAVRRGDDFYKSGEQKALHLAFRYWMLFID